MTVIVSRGRFGVYAWDKARLARQRHIVPARQRPVVRERGLAVHLPIRTGQLVLTVSTTRVRLAGAVKGELRVGVFRRDPDGSRVSLSKRYVAVKVLA